MNPQQTQPPVKQKSGQPNPAPSAAQSAANLGFVTNMHEQLLKYKAGQSGKTAPQSPQNGPQQQSEPKDEKVLEDEKDKVLEDKMDKKMETLRTELKDTIKTEIESIRNDIKSALENEQD